MTSETQGRVKRFGVFEVDLSSGELTKAGRRTPLQDQPFKVLACLLDRPGQIVTRDDLHKTLWPDDTFVEFEQGLNAAIKRLREALGDAADNPTFIETIPRRGYRFIAPVASIEPALTAPAATARETRSMSWVAIALSVCVIAGLGYLTVRAGFGGRTPKPAPERFQIEPPPGVRVADAASSPGSALAVSPDGEWVAFRGISGATGQHYLFLRSIKQLEAVVVPESLGGSDPFFSPDSAWLGFFAESQLQKVRVGGGGPVPICKVEQMRGATWLDDGTIIFSNGTGLARVSASGDEPILFTHPGAGERHYWPKSLPGNRGVLFTLHKGVEDQQSIAAYNFADKRIISLTPGSYGRYLTSGSLLYRRRGTIRAVGFQVKDFTLAGEPRDVLADVNFYEASGHAAYDVSDAGSLVYIAGAALDGDPEAELVWVDREGRPTPLTPERKPYGLVSVSPDGTRIAAMIVESQVESDLWVHQFRGGWTRLTRGMQVGQGSIWSPDGKWIFSSSFVSGKPKVFRVRADGSASPELLTSGPEWEYPRAVTQNGVLIFTRQVEPSGWQLMKLALNPLATPEPLLPGVPTGMGAALSPDGRLLAYSAASPTPGMYLRRYPEHAGPPILVAQRGGAPAWSSDSKELYLLRMGAGTAQHPVRPGNEIWSVPIRSDGELSAGEGRRLFKLDFWSAPVYAVGAGDEPRFIMRRHPPQPRSERLLHYVRHWTSDWQH